MAYITTEELTTVLTKYRPELTLSPTELNHIEWASNVLDQIEWVGSRVTSVQVNSWPRINVPIDRYDSSLGYHSSETVPEEVQLICALLAERFASDPGIVDDSAPGISVSGISLPDIDYNLFGDQLRFLISKYRKSSGGIRVLG